MLKKYMKCEADWRGLANVSLRSSCPLLLVLMYNKYKTSPPNAKNRLKKNEI